MIHRSDTPISRSADGTITNADELTSNDVAHQKVLCPACRSMTFKKWPEGWDAHATWVCAGLKDGPAKERKAIFKERYRHLFR